MRWFTRFSRCIYTSPSGYKVYDNFFYRWLTLDSSVLQTVIFKKRPQRPILYYLPALTLMVKARPGPSCLLGLGGAGVIQYLSPYRAEITAVDNSEEVIYIAQKYFMPNSLRNVTTVHQSAELYLEQCPIKYDHLLIDLYNAQSFPPECNNEHFFLHCANRLQENGFMAINLANPKEQLAILQLIKKYFLNTVVIPIRKCANVVIIATNHHDKEDFINLLVRSREIKKIALVTQWGAVADLK